MAQEKSGTTNSSSTDLEKAIKKDQHAFFFDWFGRGRTVWGGQQPGLSISNQVREKGVMRVLLGQIEYAPGASRACISTTTIVCKCRHINWQYDFLYLHAVLFGVRAGAT
jgi:hypothetical protein